MVSETTIRNGRKLSDEVSGFRYAVRERNVAAMRQETLSMVQESIKLVISYNMKPGREEACQRYMVQEIGGTLSEFGFRFTDAWYTAWGNGPQIMGSGLLDSVDVARELFSSPDWQEVLRGLEPYVEDFSVRLIQPAGTFQI